MLEYFVYSVFWLRSTLQDHYYFLELAQASVDISSEDRTHILRYLGRVSPYSIFFLGYLAGNY